MTLRIISLLILIFPAPGVVLPSFIASKLLVVPMDDGTEGSDSNQSKSPDNTGDSRSDSRPVGSDWALSLVSAVRPPTTDGGLSGLKESDSVRFCGHPLGIGLEWILGHTLMPARLGRMVAESRNVARSFLSLASAIHRTGPPTLA